eukprot:15456444-Alexandrium_andersonii.AAC.1
MHGSALLNACAFYRPPILGANPDKLSSVVQLLGALAPSGSQGVAEKVGRGAADLEARRLKAHCAN